MRITLVKNHNYRYIQSHLIKPALENYYEYVSEKYFEIIGNGFWGSNKERKIAEALPVWEIKPTLNIQNQSVPLHLFSL